MNADGPVVNEEALKRDAIDMAVQIKVRDQITVSIYATREEVEAITLAAEKVHPWLQASDGSRKSLAQNTTGNSGRNPD